MNKPSDYQKGLDYLRKVPWSKHHALAKVTWTQSV